MKKKIHPPILKCSLIGNQLNVHVINMCKVNSLELQSIVFKVQDVTFN